MKVNRLSWYKQSNGVMTEWARGLQENHFTNDWNVFFYWVTQTPTRCVCRQSYACRENMCSSEACNFFFSFSFFKRYFKHMYRLLFSVSGGNAFLFCTYSWQKFDNVSQQLPARPITRLWSLPNNNNNKETKCIPDHNPLVNNNKIFSFFNQVHILCTIPAQKKKKSGQL